MKNVVLKYKLVEQPDDVEYWLTKMSEDEDNGTGNNQEKPYCIFYNGLNI